MNKLDEEMQLTMPQNLGDNLLLRWGRPEDADALFPELTFLQLLFGYRSYEELDAAFADCYAEKAEAAVLLNALFPKRPSFVRGLN